jgi:signal transduction histidine kinase
MLRRLLPTLLALGLAYAGLVWGLWRLQRVFTEERDDTQLMVLVHRQTLEQAAVISLRQALAERLAQALPSIEAALADPRVPGEGLYLREKSVQRLPRPSPTSPPLEGVVLPAGLGTDALLRGSWYVQPVRGLGVRGVAVDVEGMLAGLTHQMRERGLLGERDVLALLSWEDVVPLGELRLSVESPRWAHEERLLARRHRVKSLLVGVCAALGAALVGLALLAQRRKLRYLELRSDFVATVSHELRTPLAAIRVMAETLERKVAGVAGARDYPTRILRETDGLTFLVENLLSFNRIDKGRWRPRLGPVRLEEVLDAVARDVRGWTEVPVELELAVGGAQVEADGQLLRLLFTNLFRNAVAYGARRPVRLAVRARAADGRERGLVVDVTDNGVGIPREAWEQVFGEFERLTGHGPEAPGSGLGLALCRRIAALHGGALRVADSSPEGTTFRLHLPGGRLS